LKNSLKACYIIDLAVSTENEENVCAMTAGLIKDLELAERIYSEGKLKLIVLIRGPGMASVPEIAHERQASSMCEKVAG
jgi:2,4-dienoyl-CoA reductase-like NADH-dependent reductase (Old Yellow Enzyme family)